MSRPEPTQPLSHVTPTGYPDLARQFWELCASIPHPDVRAFLAEAGRVSPRQLVAVLCVDLRKRWLLGEPVRAESYLADFPILKEHDDLFLELIYAEYLVFEELEGLKGQGTPDLEEYRQRFPALFERFKGQVELGRLLREDQRPEVDLPFPNIPGYEILEQVGAGGTGVVYRARQVSLGREVALKMLKETPGARSQHPERFLREAEAIARLRHPHIVQIHEIGEYQGFPFLCLEYVSGGTLADRMAQKPLPPREAAALVQTLARAVQSAHQEGIIHRDLKPGNILLVGKREPEDGKERNGAPLPAAGPLYPKITDFGLARLLGRDSELTHTGHILGTPSYMAPEQAEGMTASVGPASDIWTLGAILYALLTEKPPFMGKSVLETLELVRSTEPVPPRRFRPRLSRDLETICLKCLNKNPLQRYGSAAELADELGRFLDGQPIRARRLSPPVRALRWVRRRPTGAILIALVFLLATTGFPAAVWLWQRAELKSAAAISAQQALQTQLYYNQVSLAQEMVSLGNTARADELLDSIDPTRRGWEWHYLKRLRYGPPAVLSVPDEHLSGLDFSPDGHFLAFCTLEGNIQVLATDTRAIQFERPGALLTPAWASCRFSPDGKRLAVGGLRRRTQLPRGIEDIQTQVRILDAQTGEVLFTLAGPRGGIQMSWGRSPQPGGDSVLAAVGVDGVVMLWNGQSGQEIASWRGHDSSLFAVAFSPDSKTLAAAAADGVVKLWALPDRREIRTLSALKAAALSLTFSGDGQRLFAGGFEGIVKGWDTRNWEEVFSARHEGAGIMTLACSPDGKRLAGAGLPNTIQLWDVDTGRETLTLRGHADAVTQLAFDPKGYLLATASLDGTVKIWNATPLDRASTPEELHTSPDSDVVFALSLVHGHNIEANGTEPARLASGNLEGVLKLWDTAGRQQRSWRAHKGPISTVSVSPDGRYLASTGADRTLRVWALDKPDAKGQPRETWFLPDINGTDVAFSPDGRYVAAPTAYSWRVQMWDAQTGKEHQSFGGHPGGCLSLAFSPDGRRLASGGADNAVRVFNVKTGKQVLLLEGHQNMVVRLAFSPDGRRLASAGWDKTVKIWDTSTGDELFTLPHKDRVVTLAFHPDSRRLISGSMDGGLRLWDTQTGKEIGELRGHSGVCWSAVFLSPTELASASGYRGKGEIKFWDLTKVKINKRQE